MDIVNLKLSEITPYRFNAKKHPKEQVEQIKRSIEEFGFNDPLGVWGENNLIVEGHGRYLAAKEMGIDEIPCIRVDHLTDEQRKAYTLAHNMLTMNSDFDEEVLAVELSDIASIDMEEFGFPAEEDADDWFESRKKNDTSRQDGNDDYNEFLDKFETKKTTDDCYTPECVYDAVVKWVEKEYGVDPKKFVRPFYPNGDYQKEQYAKDCVVVDNPPFSILSEILKFYVEKGIKFFLFAPALTLFSGRGLEICYLPIGVTITYENGAKVCTSFITNMEKGIRLRTSGEFYKVLKEADNQNREAQKAELPNYEYPPELVTAAGLSRYSVHGVDFVVPSDACCRVSELDSMKEMGKAIFGGGYLLSREMTAQNVKALRQKAENAKRAELERLTKAAEGGEGIVNEDGKIVWKLSERELQIIKDLSEVSDG